MKKINILFVIILLGVVFFTSCEKDADDHKYGGAPIIAFQSLAGSISEADTVNTISIPVFMAKTSEVTGTINFDFDTVGIANPAVEGVDFEVVNDSKTLSFEAGQYIANIEIKPIDNKLYQGNKVVNVVLTTGSAGVIVGYDSGESNVSFALTIADNEHPLSIVIGNYTVNYVSGYDGSNGSVDIETFPHPDNETQIYFLLDTWVGHAGYSGTYTEDDWVLCNIDLSAGTIKIASGQKYPDGTYGEITLIGYDATSGDDMEDGDFIEGTFDANGNITITDGMYLPFTDGPNVGYSFDDWSSSQWTKNAK